MDDDTVHISDSEESQAAISRLVKVIENWATKESQKSDYELSAFGAALASGIVAFHEITAKDCRSAPGLMSAVSRAQKHLTRQHQQFDSEIDKMHLKFAQEMEELDLKIIRDRKELDLINQTETESFFRREKIDQVFLAAAKVGGIYANNNTPADFIYENIMIQSNIIHNAF